MVEFPCQCSPDGDCGKGAGLATWFAHTSGTFHLYEKTCGEWRKVLTLDESEVKHLLRVSDYDSECDSWGKEFDKIEKVRYGSFSANPLKTNPLEAHSGVLKDTGDS